MKRLPLSEKNQRTVYVRNLSYERDEKSIKKIFAPFGKVLSVKVVIDLESRKSKGMAFVEMEDVESARNAILNLHETLLDERTIKVTSAKPQKKKFYLNTEKKSIPQKKADPKRERPKKAKKKSGLEIMFENIKKRP